MTQERRLSAEIQNLEKPKNTSTLLGVFASRKGEWPRRQERFNCLSLPECWESKRNRTPLASPVFRKAGMTLTIQFPSTSEIFDNRITCYCLYAIACFPTAALILIKKYIWVRIWIAKCDLRPLDFAQKCPQNAGNAISENQISNIFRGSMSWTPLEMSSLWPNGLGAPNLSWPPQLNRSQHITV